MDAKKVILIICVTLISFATGNAQDSVQTITAKHGDGISVPREKRIISLIFPCPLTITSEKPGASSKLYWIEP